MPWPLCDNCGRREATSIYGGSRADGTPWELALCSPCDPNADDPPPDCWDDPLPVGPPELPPGVPLSDDELDELARRFGA